MTWQVALALLSIVYCAVMWRMAWLGDDALITLRSVQNFIHGYGPVFNVNERVQSFTHTSWFFLVTAATLVAGSPYLGVVTSSFLINLATLGVLLRRFGKGTIYILCALLLSKAFMDFANSGLENPLTFLLLALLILLVPAEDTPRKWMLTGLYCGLLILTRPDLGLMLVAVAAVFFRRPGFAWITVGLLPLLAWEIFSLFYYGSLIPNTALAKLDTGVPRVELIVQGLIYLIQTAVFDPLTILIIVFFLCLSFHRKSLRFVAGFVLLYIAYTIWIGGDFMIGRFFTPPFFASLIGIALLLREQPVSRIWELRAAWAMVIAGLPVIYLNLLYVAEKFINHGSDFEAAAFFTPPSLASLFGLALLIRNRPPQSHRKPRMTYLAMALVGLPAILLKLIVGSNYDVSIVNGITDERGWYTDLAGYGLADGAMSKGFPLIPEWRLRGTYPQEVFIVCGGLGTGSLIHGPNVHFIDPCGLTDPLLARLPSVQDADWRIGHFFRNTPEGYVESVKGENVLAITPPYIDALHKDIKIALSSPLLEPARLGAIWRLHTKDYGIVPEGAANATQSTNRIMHRFTCQRFDGHSLVDCQ